MRENPDESGLEALFAEARAKDARPPAALVARVLADAEAQRPGVRASGWGAVLRAIGGWPSAAGLVAASAAGLAIGLAAPDMLPLGGTATDAAYELIDLAPGYGAYAAFGG